MQKYILKINNKNRKKMLNIFVSCFVIFALFISSFSLSFSNKAEAVFNKQINYQGKLTTSANVAVANGTYNMEFKLYDSGSTVLWTETRTGANKVQVTSGLFSVMLGEVNALTSVDFNQTLYLGVNIGGTGTPGWDGEMSPRKKLGAVPAAVVTENSNITNDATTASAVYPTWVTTNSGGMPLKTSSAQLSFIPSTGSLTVTGSVNSPTIDASSAVAMNLGILTQTALTMGRVGANTTINGAIVNINSNAASALNITSGTTGALTLDSGTTGIINIGTGTSGKTINIGTNNTTADTIIIGSALDTIRLAKFTTDGFLKTNSANGTLSVDTNTYLTTTSAGTTYVPYTGATSNVDLGVHNLTVDTNSVFVDATNHRVSIGTLTPASGTKLQVNGVISSPDSGVRSERFGLGSSASGNFANVFGNGSSVAGDYSSAFGADVVVNGNYSTAFGSQTTLNGDDSLVLGEYSTVGSVAHGISRSIAMGTDNNIDASNVVALGGLISTSYANTFLVGSGTSATAPNQVVIGSNGLSKTDVFFGNGVNNATPSPYTIHGTSGYGTNIAGANINIAGGQGTGTGTGGAILFQTSGAGTTGASMNALTERMRIDSAGNIGIGTTSPAYHLDVKGTATSDGIRSDMGFDIYQVPDPSTPTGVVSAGGSVDTGAHTYYITYITATGETHSIPSAVITTTTGNNTVTLTIPVSTDPRVTGRKIYRTKVGGWQDYYVGTVANNTSTTYVDTVADSTLTGIALASLYRTNTTSQNITINGIKSLTIDSRGTYLGINAGSSITSGGTNVFMGNKAGMNATSAINSVFIGEKAGGVGNITGSANIFIGANTAQNATSGNDNTIVGSSAIVGTFSGSGNSIFGTSSGENLSTGSFNTGLGNLSLAGISTSSSNTGLGYRAGQYIADGATLNVTSGTSLYLGANTKAGASGNTNEIVIGYNTIGNGSNTATIGNTSTLRTYLTGLNLKAGTATAGTSPLKFTSGTLLSTTEAGSIEFNNDAYYGTITTGAGTAGARKQFAFTSDLTSGYVPYTGATTNVDLGAHSLTVDSDINAANPNDNNAVVFMGWLSNMARIRVGGTGTGSTNGFDIEGPSNTSWLRIAGTGEVGIGTAPTTAKLTVNGVITNNDRFETSNPNNANASTYFGWLNDVARIRVGGTGAGSANGLDIETIGDVSLMRILHSGSVGIGTTGPGEKLEVYSGNLLVNGGNGIFKGNTGGCATNCMFTIDPQNAAGPRLSLGDVTTPTSYFELGAWSSINNFDSKTRDLKLYNAGGSIYLKNSTGNVGIGLTSPTALLHLKAGTSTSNTAPLKFTSGTNLGTAEAGAMEWDGTNLFITQTTGPTRKTLAYTTDIPSVTGYVPYTGANANVNLGTYTLTTPTVLGGSSTTSPLTFQTTSGVGTTGADMHFKVGNNGATEAMTILNNGNVGIGNTAPASILDITSNAGDANSLGMVRFLNPNATTAGRLTSMYFGRAAASGGAGELGYYSDTTTPANGVITLTNWGDSELTASLAIKKGGNVGIGITSPTSQLSQKSTAALESAPLGTEITDGTGWTSTGWTGSYNSFTHTAGNTTALSRTMTTVAGSLYQISWTVTGRTAGSFTIAFAGTAWNNNSQTATGAFGPKATNTSGGLVISPTTDFDGTISNISVKLISSYGSIYDITDSTGAVYLQTRSNTASLNNLFMGKNAGQYNTTGYANLGFGSNALQSNTTGNTLLAIGSLALQSNTTGYQNLAIGGGALQANTNGFNNTAVGSAALYNNTSGTFNVAVGPALYGNTIGQGNVGIGGYGTLSINSDGGNNIAIGQYSMTSNVSGSNNVAIGSQSMWYITASNNIAMGFKAGRFITDGATANATSNNSVYLGYDTRASANGDTNETVIGYSAIGNGSNTVTLGNSSNLRTYLAGLNLKAGSATSGTAPIKLTSGNTLSTPETGAMEYDGTDLYFTATGTSRKAIAYADGTTLYHSTKWFTPTGGSTISTSGTTVTMTGSTQFTAAMVGAKIIINGEQKIITGYTSSSVVTVASAFGTNYSGVAAANFGVYSKMFEATDGTNTNVQYFSNGTKELYLDQNSNYVSLSNYSVFGANLEVGSTLINTTSFDMASNNTIRFSNSTFDEQQTKDTGIRRSSAGVLEIYDGVTNGAFRDLNLRTLTASVSVISPLILGGSSTTSPLTFQTTSGVGTTGADMHFKVGNNGGTEAMTILNNGNVGVAVTSPSEKLDILGNIKIGQSGLSTVSSAAASFSQKFYGNFWRPTFGATEEQAGAIYGIPTVNNVSDTPSVARLTMQAAASGGSMVDVLSALGNGNVGIGTTGPLSRLHIVQPDDSQFGLIVERTNTNIAGRGLLNLIGRSPLTGVFVRSSDLKLMNTDSTVGNYTSIVNNNSIDQVNSGIDFVNVDQAYNGAIRFNTRSLAGSYGERMRIDGTGNVGIGTTGPNSKLDIKPAAISGKTLTIETSTGTNALQLGTYTASESYAGFYAGNITPDAANFTFIGNGGSETVFNVPNSNGAMAFRRGNSSTSMQIDGAGNVGIGNTGPSYKLDVTGDINATSSVISPYVIGGILTTSDLYFKTTTAAGASGSDMHFLVGNNGAIEAMTILNDGKVGINNSAPSEALDVNGNIETTGSMKFTNGFLFEQVASPASVTVKKGTDAIMVFDEL